MYPHLLATHSALRWIFLGFLLFTLVSALRGYLQNTPYRKSDAVSRKVTVGLAHLQLLFGFGLYFISPVVRTFRDNHYSALGDMDVMFFGILHMAAMLLVTIAMTVGSALTGRKATDTAKFKTVLMFFGISFLVILVFIPWPFSPLASRPWFRGF